MKPAYVMHNGAWREVKDAWVMHNGAWRRITGGWVMHNGAWRPTGVGVLETPQPELLVKSLLEPAEPGSEGELVRAVAVPWFLFVEMIQRDPESIYRIDPQVWEELIAGAYQRAGYEVILTPRSGDFGRDVVATKRGVGSIRIFDQVRAKQPGNVVTAEEVRAMLGVITGAQNVSKGVITTTSTFAPRISDDPYISPYIPYRLELKGRDKLLPWLEELSGTAG